MDKITYAVLRLIPNARRQEIINVGLAIFDGSYFRLKLLKNFAKVKGLCPSFQLDLFPSLEEDLRFLTGDAVTYEDVHATFNSMGGFRLGPETELRYNSRSELSEKIELLMEEYVYPETNTPDAHPLTLFQALRKEIAKVAEITHDRRALDQFGIVEWYAVDSQGWLKSEFAYRADSKTVFIQTVDLQVDDRRELFRTISSKKMVGDAIRDAFKDAADILVAYRISERARRVGGDYLLTILQGYASEVHDLSEASQVNVIADRVAWTQGPNKSLPLVVH